ncbi:MAG: hypothetical protein J2P13_04850 [Acidobacteria bacterium]|nr:hypothetical protein [Acidobacteriota bacterium]
MLLLAGLSLWGTPAGAAGEHWLRISSDHFIVITDGNEKAGHEVAVRFEQMRAIFGQLLMRSKVRMAEPLEIIALAGDQEYAPLAPRIDGQPAVGPGLWLAGDDRIFVVLNLAEPASWEGIAHQFAHYLLNYNYPPTPAWFDEGFAEYFASLHLRSKYAEVGGDPELTPAGADPAGNQAHAQDLKSFAEILRNPVWLAWPDLLATRNRTTRGAEGAQHTLFYAQSWILVHYLLNKDKMSDLGKYFGLVEIQKVPTEEAIRQGFGVSVAELDHEVKDYFRGLAPKLGASGGGQPADAAKPVYQLPLPFEDLGTSSKPVPVAEAQALVDEMQLRLSPRRQSAFADLEKLIADPKTETVVAHRALAWAYIEKGETDDAFKELNQAVHINDRDPWTRFGLALASYHSGQQGARVQGLANMMESLHVVIDEYPDFAEAYNMLGWARLAGGGPNAAVDSMKMAVELSPRSEPYQLRLAQAYLEAKKFSQATPILDRLKLSQSPEVAETASKALTDLPFLEKYGVPPEPAAVPKSSAGTANTGPADEEDDQTASNRKPAEAEPAIDKRAVKFLKATLVSVDCSKPPAAMLSVAQGNRLLKLRTPDYKSLPVIGAQDFSCAWKGIRVNINYRPSGLTGGDLVSIEIPEAGRQ